MQSMVSHGTTTIAPTPTADSLFIYFFFHSFFCLKNRIMRRKRKRVQIRTLKAKPWLLPMAITMTALMAIFVFCFVFLH